MAFWRRVREWIIGLLFGALLVGTIGAPSAQLFFALQTLRFINSNGDVHGPPLGDQISISLRFSVDGAIIGIAGAGLFWLSTLVAGPERGNARSRRQKACELGSLPLCGCVCLISAVIELISIKKKRKFLPLLSDSVQGTSEWPVNTHSELSFWNIADAYFAAQMGVTLDDGSTAGGSARPFGTELAAYHFLVEYRIQIIATTCLFFLGLGLIGTVMLDVSDRFQRRTILSRLGYNITTWIGVICILSVAGPIFLVFEFFEKVAPWTRYHRAYAAKVCERPMSRLRPIIQRIHETMFAAGWRMRHVGTWTAGSRVTKRFTPDIEMGMGKATPTAKSPIMAICKYDLAIVLSEQMHYTDLVALSQTSRAWHDCIFPPDRELRAQQARLKAYTCMNSPREIECWSCTRNVCPGCRAPEVEVHQDMTLFHQLRCVPYCKGCFRTLAKGNITRQGCKSSKARVESVSICWPCRNDSREPFLWKGSRKWNYMLRQRNLRWSTCAKCSEPLETKGARFWVCRKPNCEHECRSSAHLNWIGPNEQPVKTSTITETEIKDNEAAEVGQHPSESDSDDLT